MIAEKAITTEWSTRTDLPEAITTNARITYSVQDKYSSVWTVRVDATDKDDTQLHYILSVTPIQENVNSLNYNLSDTHTAEPDQPGGVPFLPPGSVPCFTR